MRRFSAMARDWRKWHPVTTIRARGCRSDSSSYRSMYGARSMRCHLVRSARSVRVRGEGRDLLGVLADHPRRADVIGRLVELDPELAATAAAHAPPGVDVVCGDASTTSAYAGAVPADIVLACGIFGNISVEDIHHTVETLPQLCAAGATVIWTRHRRPPDLTIDIRRWFADGRLRGGRLRRRRRIVLRASARTASSDRPPVRARPTAVHIRRLRRADPDYVGRRRRWVSRGPGAARGTDGSRGGRPGGARVVAELARVRAELGEAAVVDRPRCGRRAPPSTAGARPRRRCARA